MKRFVCNHKLLGIKCECKCKWCHPRHKKVTVHMKHTLTVLKTGALSIQVCTDAKRKADIERLTNQASLCGTTGGWVLDEKESKRLGQPMVKCADDPNRRHYILYA